LEDVAIGMWLQHLEQNKSVFITRVDSPRQVLWLALLVENNELVLRDMFE
jgi:hypothetical protein